MSQNLRKSWFRPLNREELLKYTWIWTLKEFIRPFFFLQNYHFCLNYTFWKEHLKILFVFILFYFLFIYNITTTTTKPLFTILHQPKFQYTLVPFTYPILIVLFWGNVRGWEISNFVSIFTLTRVLIMAQFIQVVISLGCIWMNHGVSEVSRSPKS